MGFGEAGEGGRRRLELGEQFAHGPGGEHHQGRVEHVLAGQRRVNGPYRAEAGAVQGPDLFTEVGEQRDDGVAAALSAHGDVRDVVALHVRGGGHHRGGPGRGEARLIQDRRPGRLDLQDGGEHRTVPGQRRHERRRRHGTQQAKVAVQAKVSVQAAPSVSKKVTSRHPRRR